MSADMNITNPPPTKPDTFQTDSFYSTLAKGTIVQWDYRDHGGKLFSGMVVTIEQAEQAAAKHGYMKAGV